MTNFKRWATRALCCVALALSVPFALAQDSVAPRELLGSVESIGVFKNGVAAIVERYDVPEAGEYVISTAPQPLHGAFFVQSDATLDARADFGNVELDLADANDFDWTKDLAGQWFQVVLPGETTPKTVRVPFVSKSADNVEQDYALRSNYAPVRALRSGVFLETEEHEMIWLANPGEITKILLPPDALPKKVVRRRSRLRLKITKTPNDQGAVVKISYLTKGLCWAPQYRVTLKDDNTLELTQSALVVNEWRDFSAEKFTLYSGFPRILFKDALSPIDPSVSLASYFASLNGNLGGNYLGASQRGAIVTQQLALNNAVGFDVGTAPTYAIQDGEENADGVDVYAKQVGAKALAKNERALFTLARKDAEYKRVVCWNIADARDANGNLNPANVNSSSELLPSAYARTTAGEAAFEHTNRFVEPWDVIEFNNPLNYPITTGPATTISANDAFIAQDMFYWTNPGEKTLLPITKSLSVKVRSIENERDLAQAQVNFNPTQVDPNNLTDFNWVTNESNWGRFFVFRGINYRIAVYDAEITLINTRKDEVEMRLSRQFTGQELQKSFEGFEPETTQIGYQNSWEQFVNKRCEMKWVTVLEPGETKVLKFSYLRLIRQ